MAGLVVRSPDFVHVPLADGQSYRPWRTQDGNQPVLKRPEIGISVRSGNGESPHGDRGSLRAWFNRASGEISRTGGWQSKEGHPREDRDIIPGSHSLNRRNGMPTDRTCEGAH